MFFLPGQLDPSKSPSRVELEEHRGKFAVLCGQRLLGMYNSLDLALRTVSIAFQDGLLEHGEPICINEISDVQGLRLVAGLNTVAESIGPDGA